MGRTMREIDGRRLPRRVVGRAAIARSLALTAIRLARFAECRAASRADQVWAAAVGDQLRIVLELAYSGSVVEQRVVGHEPGDVSNQVAHIDPETVSPKL